MPEQFSGFHSDIQLASLGERLMVQKVYGRKNEIGTPEDVQNLKGAMQRFDRLAIEIGVPIATSESYDISALEGGRVELCELSEYSGDNLRHVLTGEQIDDKTVLCSVEEVLRLHKKCWDVDWKISLDPPLANFCISEVGIKYIDKMPPRQKMDDGSCLSETPLPGEKTREFIEGRYFGPRQAQVIYAQLLRDLRMYPHLMPDVKQQVGAILGEDAYRLIDIPQEVRSAMIESPVSEDCDSLRIIAGERFACGEIDEDALHGVFSFTHIHPGGILPDQTEIEQAAGFLRS